LNICFVGEGLAVSPTLLVDKSVSILILDVLLEISRSLQRFLVTRPRLFVELGIVQEIGEQILE
jgi:hypothetical protein